VARSEQSSLQVTLTLKPFDPFARRSLGNEILSFGPVVSCRTVTVPVAVRVWPLARVALNGTW
jgi:hypothetical protein